MKEEYTYRLEARMTLRKIGPRGEWLNDSLTVEQNADMGVMDLGQAAKLMTAMDVFIKSVTGGNK